MSYCKSIFVRSTVFMGVSLFLLLTGCASLVVKQVFPIIENTEKVLLNEEDEELVKMSLPFAIKFTEGLYEYSPSAQYASKLTLLYAAYTFAYRDEGPYSDFDEEADQKVLNSRRLYQKAFDYGILALEKRIRNFDKILFLPEERAGWLAKIGKKEVEALFWLNFSWAMLLFLDSSDLDVLVHIETIRDIAKRLCVVDANYYYGGCHSILMAYYGGRSEAIGGDLDEALRSYAAAKEKSERLSLLPQYVYMRFVAPAHNDVTGFDAAYQIIENFKLVDNPDFSFINAFIKRKATALVQRRDEIF